MTTPLLTKTDIATQLEEPECTNLFPTEADVASAAIEARILCWEYLGTSWALDPDAMSDGEKHLLVAATIVVGLEKRPALVERMPIYYTTKAKALAARLSDLRKRVSTMKDAPDGENTQVYSEGEDDPFGPPRAHLLIDGTMKQILGGD